MYFRTYFKFPFLFCFVDLSTLCIVHMLCVGIWQPNLHFLVHFWTLIVHCWKGLYVLYKCVFSIRPFIHSVSYSVHFHKKSKKTERAEDTAMDKDLLQTIHSYFTINESVINAWNRSCVLFSLQACGVDTRRTSTLLHADKPSPVNHSENLPRLTKVK